MNRELFENFDVLKMYVEKLYFNIQGYLNDIESFRSKIDLFLDPNQNISGIEKFKQNTINFDDSYKALYKQNTIRNSNHYRHTYKYLYYSNPKTDKITRFDSQKFEYQKHYIPPKKNKQKIYYIHSITKQKDLKDIEKYRDLAVNSIISTKSKELNTINPNETDKEVTYANNSILNHNYKKEGTVSDHGSEIDTKENAFLNFENVSKHKFNKPSLKKTSKNSKNTKSVKTEKAVTLNKNSTSVTPDFYLHKYLNEKIFNYIQNEKSPDLQHDKNKTPIKNEDKKSSEFALNSKHKSSKKSNFSHKESDFGYKENIIEYRRESNDTHRNSRNSNLINEKMNYNFSIEEDSIIVNNSTIKNLDDTLNNLNNSHLSDQDHSLLTNKHKHVSVIEEKSVEYDDYSEMDSRKRNDSNYYKNSKNDISNSSYVLKKPKNTTPNEIFNASINYEMNHDIISRPKISHRSSIHSINEFEEDAENHVGKNIYKHRTSMNSMAQKMALGENEFKNLMYDLNKYPKSIILIDNQLDILFYNKNLSKILLYNSNELLQTNITNIIKYDKSTVTDLILGIIENMTNYNKTTEEIGDVMWDIYDKDKNLVTFICRFNIHTINNGADEYNFLIIYMVDQNSEDKHCSFNPDKNSLYLLWSMVIGLSIVFLIVYTPYDLVFNDPDLGNFTYWSDMVITAIYTVDIGINFFVAYYDIYSQSMIYDNKLVALKYLKTTLLIDIISTVPFDIFFNAIAFNTSILKSIKITRAFKFIKVFRIIKYYTFLLSKSNMIKETLGEKFWINLKQTSGLFELMVINLYILIGAHFHCLIFYYVRVNFIGWDEGQWLIDYYNISNFNTFHIYLKILHSNVMTSMGLGVIDTKTNLEVFLTMVWMFTGLSMFGYGIGNISSYLSNAIQDEIEYLNARRFFEQLCETNIVDHRIYQKVISDIEYWHSHENEMRFLKMGYILSPQTMNQLELAMYSDFLNSFRLFPKLKISAVRTFKNNSKEFKKQLNLYYGGIMSDVYFIIGGKMSIYDDRMNLVNDYGPNEIYGLSYFQHHCYLKYKIEISSVIEKYTSAKNMYESDKTLESYVEAFYRITEEIRDKMAKVAPKMGNDNLQEDELIQLTINYNPIATEDIEYFTIPFKTFEDMLSTDLDSFYLMWRYNLQYFDLITEEDRDNTKEKIYQFKNNDWTGIMVANNGEVHDVNNAVIRMNIGVEFESILGQNIFQLLNGNNFSTDNIDELIAEGIFYIKLNEDTVKLDIQHTEDMSLCKFNSDDEDVSNYYRLKKSMLNVKAVYFLATLI